MRKFGKNQKEILKLLVNGWSLGISDDALYFTTYYIFDKDNNWHYVKERTALSLIGREIFIKKDANKYVYNYYLKPELIEEIKSMIGVK